MKMVSFGRPFFYEFFYRAVCHRKSGSPYLAICLNIKFQLLLMIFILYFFEGLQHVIANLSWGSYHLRQFAEMFVDTAFYRIFYPSGSMSQKSRR